MNGSEFLRAGRRLVQYVWDSEPTNEDDSPIWCLGERYESYVAPDKSSTTPASSTAQPPPNDKPAGHESTHDKPLTTSENDKTQESAITAAEDESYEKIEPQNDTQDNGWPPAFLDDVETKIWLTYRQDFPPIARSTNPNSTSGMSFATKLKMIGNKEGFRSDTGWGCMIRSGQSLLANSLAILDLGRDWRKGEKQDAEAKLLSLFADDPSAPFSIHRFVEHGASACGKHPGEWFGPSATARCIHALTTTDSNPSNLRVYVRPDDSDVYEDSFLSIAKPTPDGPFHPTLILLGTRLGIDRVTPAYWASLASLFALPQTVGIAGGRPSSSHYFFGVQGDRYFYLDPHFTRPMLPLNPEEKDMESCHTRRLRWLQVTQMDPSMLLGFLIRNEQDWKTWRTAVTKKPDAQTDGGKSSSVIHVHDFEPTLSGGDGRGERAEAVDEVQSCDEDMGSGAEEDGDTVVC